ncbi:MAG: hypothetical protein Q7R94_02295 [bacterium]|nr:hypothetical protein [bacterium]
MAGLLIGGGLLMFVGWWDARYHIQKGMFHPVLSFHSFLGLLSVSVYTWWCGEFLLSDNMVTMVNATFYIIVSSLVFFLGGAFATFLDYRLGHKVWSWSEKPQKVL